MRIQLDDEREVQVGVAHEEKMVPIPVSSGETKDQQRRVTTVRLTLRRQGPGGGEIVIGTLEGKAICNPMDQFQKVQGRRRALRQAFEGKTLLSKEDRRKIYGRLLSKIIGR